jgi:hypothetical protein
VDLCDAAAERRVVIHLRHHVCEKEHLAIAGAGNEGHFLALEQHVRLAQMA